MRLIELEEMINQFKIVKSDIVYLKGQTIFGFDNALTIVKETQFMNPNNISIVIQIKEWLEMFKALKESNVKYENKEVDIFNGEYISYKGKDYYYKSAYILRELNRKISNIYSLLQNYQPNVFIKDLRQDNNFKPTLDKEFKTDNGMYLYRLKQYCMSIYKSLLGITIKDNISIDIYDYSELYFMSRYTISNKNFSLNVYINLRKLP